MHLFDDLLASVTLYLDAWSNPGEPDGVTESFLLLREQAKGLENFTSLERERIYRDAAIREAARRGDSYAAIAQRYCMSPSRISRIALAGGERRRGGVAA
jgi:hypothetical protein